MFRSEPQALRGLRLITSVVAVTISLGVIGAPRAEAATLSLAAGTANAVSIAGSRTSSLTSVSVTVPTTPIDFGLQVRAATGKNGYRAIVSVKSDGTVYGLFRRAKNAVSTALGSSVKLGFSAKAGEVIKLEAAVAGTSPVRLYLRAWKSGSFKPPNWQHSVSDSSSSRFQSAGTTLLYAWSPKATKVSYSSVTAASYTQAAADAVGVVQPEPNGNTFSIGVIPDTQTEVHSADNARFLGRTKWMVASRQQFDLRYVLHTGDVTNWGWLDQAQLTRAREAMAVIGNAGLPYALSIGNHDTAAVGWNGVVGSAGYGGSAYQSNPECLERLSASECKSWLLVRHTEDFNRTFPLSKVKGVGGVFESGKVDNMWTTFTANDTKWLVLTLELWPRKSAVAWAKNVVATHQGHNVVIQTHAYLTASGTISTSNGGYGETSPTYLYEQIVSKYKNVKLVFSGHNGTFMARKDSPSGNAVVSFLGNDQKTAFNPVRMVTINTATGSVYSAVYDPMSGQTLNPTVHQIKIVR